jgi:uncharacterized membrane protein
MRKEKKLVLVALTLFLCGFVCEVLAVYPILSNALFNANLPNVLGSVYAMIISGIGMALVFVALVLAIVGVALSQK